MDVADMRRALATRVLAPLRLFFFSALPPLVGLCGASVACCTNCFSVGKRLRSGPYSLSTASTARTPSASIVVASTPLIRYRAWRRDSSPRALMCLALFTLFSGGACCFLLLHFRQYAQDLSVVVGHRRLE